MLANPPQHWQLGEASIRTQELPRRRRASDEGPDDKPEISFDGNDNVLLDPSALSFARAEAWPLHLRRYLDAIEAELGREFQRAAINLHIGEGHVRANIPRTPDYALKEVETYFEFSHRNPLKLMRRLRPILESMVETYRTRVFKVLRAEADNDRDSPRVLLTLAGGRQLRIYAKTNKRVRFEVIHDVTNPSVNRLLHEDRGGYTTESRDELLGWFSRLAHDAADKINHMLSLLQDRIQIPSNSANTYELISGIFSTVRNVQRANDVVRLLVEEGSLRVNRRGSDYMLEIEQLRRKDILQNENGANTVTPPYRTALDELRRQANLPPLYGRRQSRRRRST